MRSHLKKVISRRHFCFLSFCLLPYSVFAQSHAAKDATVSTTRPAFAKKIQIRGVSDAGKLNDFLYRGSQPKPEGVEQLKKLGVDTIVDLRGERPGTIKKERERVESLGMR